MDFYDGMLSSIQQFPLEANVFERAIRRIHIKYSRYKARYKRLLSSLTSPDSPAFVKAQRKLLSCLRRKQKAIAKYSAHIHRQMENLERLKGIGSNYTGGLSLTAQPVTPLESLDIPSVLRVKPTSVLNEKHCICRTTNGGAMICCDSPACSIRWYHLHCIGMTSIPSSGWLCEKCRKSGFSI